jgi:hypothetical protein
MLVGLERPSVMVVVARELGQFGVGPLSSRFCAVALKAIQRGLIDKLVFVNFGSTLSENE